MKTAVQSTGIVFLVGGRPDDNARWQKRLARIPSCHLQSAPDPIACAKENGGIVCIVNSDGSITIATAEDAAETGVELRGYSIKPSMDDDQIAMILSCVSERARLQREIVSAQKAALEFCHLAAHDLKAPARRIAQFCEILKEENAEILAGASADYIERIIVNATRLQNLIAEILVYSEASTPQEERQMIDSNALLHKIAEDFQNKPEGKDATIDIGSMPSNITGYPSALEQMFRHLIDNSLKYRGKEKPVIRVSCNEKATQFVFTFNDNGEGIDEKFHECVFRPFERLHSQDEIEGAGLGLAICEKIAAMHDGKIWLGRSAPGKGSSFMVAINKN